MGSVFSEHEHGRTLTGFTDFDADGSERLLVAVLWRHPAPRTPRRAPGAAILGILGAIGGFVGHWVRRAPPPRWELPPGWSGSRGGEDDSRAVLYHRNQRRVRVLGEEYDVPADGRTAVLLVDEMPAGSDAGRPGGPRVRVLTLTMPAQPIPIRDAGPVTGRQRRAWVDAPIDALRLQQAAWREHLLADEVIGAFWNAPGSSG